MEAEKTIRIYCGLAAITHFGASFFFATYTIYLQAHGLGPMEVNLVNACFYAAIFALEIPTGAVADLAGRKPSYVISCFVLCASFLLYAFSDSFGEFVLAEIVGAVAITFSSGAFQSWLVDRLKFLKYDVYGEGFEALSKAEQGRQESNMLGPIMAREAQYSRAAILVGVMTGAWLNDQNMKIPWIVAGLIQLVVGLLALVLMKEEGFRPGNFSWKSGYQSMRKTILISYVYARRKKPVRFLLLTASLVTAAMMPINMQWQPFFARFVGEKTTTLGLIFAGCSMAMFLGARLSGRFKRAAGSDKNTILLIMLLTGVGLSATAYSSFPMALVLYLVHQLTRGMYFPLKDAYLNSLIPSRRRATLLSFESMTGRIGGVGGLLLSGLLAEYFSYSFAWVISGGLLIIATLWLMRNGRT